MQREMPQTELIRKIAFSSIKGITRSTAAELLKRVGSVDVYFSATQRQLTTITDVSDFCLSEDYRNKTIEDARCEYEFITSNNIEARFFNDDNYPSRLKDCDDAPTMVYSLGNCDLESRHIIAIVGTRHATPYGVDFVNRLVHDLAESLDSLVIVSGLAYGIDAAAHRAALNENVPTAAVLAHGLNTIYPAEHRSLAKKMIGNGGMLLTEYKTSSPVHKGNFLARNRIVAGLSDVVIVVESDIKGGAMATARIADAYNRQVLTVPGRVSDTYSRGCNELIARQTAMIVRNAEDVLNIMGWSSKPKAGVQKELFAEVTPTQTKIIDFITANPDATVNEICVGLAIPYAQLSSELFEMEMRDLIIVLPGGKYGVIGG
jgi:DNA processing protein